MTETAARLNGRVALVTGAARGIGRAIADRLHREGAAVWYTDIDGDEAARAADDAGAPAIARALDIADRVAADDLVAEIERTNGRLDILVNNAAILDMTGVDDLNEAHFKNVLDINLTGALTCTLASVELMARTGGRILNIASIMGLYGHYDAIPYSAAKGGLVNLTRCLACDLSDRGITVNAIAPRIHRHAHGAIARWQRPRARNGLVQGGLSQTPPPAAGACRQAGGYRRPGLFPCAATTAPMSPDRSCWSTAACRRRSELAEFWVT